MMRTKRLAHGLALATMGFLGGCNAIMRFEPGTPGDPCTAGEACYGGAPASLYHGICIAGRRLCGADGSSSCVGEVLPGEETCNGYDDDCNGEVDEVCPCVGGSSQPCHVGPPGTQGVGICRGGTQACTDGAWGACDGAEGPAEEVPNGADDDCDGVTDDGFGCAPGAQQACYQRPGGVVSGELQSKSGVIPSCRKGTQACADGSWGSCEGQILPEEEICNGEDDDCNGVIDDGDLGLDQECSVEGERGECARGSQRCEDGALRCTSDRTPTQEICDDERDNDCDGQIDEDCPSPQGSMRRGDR
ncbi:MopE-related protein [Sorangium sp. So ce1151]|uniref:MopE-related protein n=1 Tax=Sorangium sp. So ce1151 TaxID=3133332 RepID=UPI003F5D7959